jgi:hypothetical protein
MEVAARAEEKAVYWVSALSAAPRFGTSLAAWRPLVVLMRGSSHEKASLPKKPAAEKGVSDLSPS